MPTRYSLVDEIANRQIKEATTYVIRGLAYFLALSFVLLMIVGWIG